MNDTQRRAASDHPNAHPPGSAPDTPPDDGSHDEPRWRLLGPSLLVAATGIGAGDLVATLVAGSRFGYALLWAAVIGVLVKIALVEGAGRWSLATGHSIYEGWRRCGRWAGVYFGIYIVVWGFVYGATAMSASALPLAAAFPQVPLTVFAVLSGLLGAVLVWFGHYQAFEKIIGALVGLMFVTVVGAALVTVPNLPGIARGLIPTIPDGSLIYTLSIIGGVGGTITLAAYGYWLKEKGWATPRWMRVMRIDNTVAYIISGIFVIAMLIVGAELLYSAGITIADGDQGLLDLAVILEQRYGPIMKWFFLIGFWASSFSSVLGVWNGVSLMFADFFGAARGLPEQHPDRGIDGRPYKGFILWLTFPPMLLLLIGKPFGIIIAYGVLGALFMPFLAVTLLFLLNSRHMPRRWRNGPLMNLVLGVVTLLFVVLGVNQLLGLMG